VILALAFASPCTVSDASAFERWLSSAGLATTDGQGVALRLGEFRELHAAVVSALEAAALARPVPPGAARRLNDASALVPFAPALAVRDGRTVLVDDPSPRGRAVDVLASVARSAIRLLGSDVARRLRRCPACRAFFVASRRDRVWCSDACGNRARVARHHRRRRAGGTDLRP
jgi:predicted RNA-binding Zn ribbon-like protein